jgi:hypothetical protein
MIPDVLAAATIAGQIRADLRSEPRQLVRTGRAVLVAALELAVGHRSLLASSIIDLTVVPR